MFNKGQLAGLMKQAQAMQDNLKRAQDELANIEVEGHARGGLDAHPGEAAQRLDQCLEGRFGQALRKAASCRAAGPP